MFATAVNQLLPSGPFSYGVAWIKFHSCDPLCLFYPPSVQHTELRSYKDCISTR